MSYEYVGPEGFNNVSSADSVVRLKIPREPDTTAFMLQNCHDISVQSSRGIPNINISDVVRQKI
jgi:hypothetical protein